MFNTRLFRFISRSEPVLRISLTLALLLVYASLACWPLAAFNYPWELEVREGTVWLQVLASKSGADIYDHSSLLYVNMNHGPIDPLVKLLIAYVFPILSGWQVTRFFALALPFLTFFVSYLALSAELPWRFNIALITSSLLYASLFLLADMFLVIGRSDPTAICSILLLECYIIRNYWCNSFLKNFTIGVLSACVFLTSWRVGAFALILCAFLLVWSAIRFGLLASSKKALYLLIGGLTPCTLLIVSVFHADLNLYYQHFFGFFLSQGSGTFPAASWNAVWQALISNKISLYLIIASIISVASALLYLLVRRDSAAVGFLICNLCIVCCIGLAAVELRKNMSGGGIYYLFPVLTVFWMFVVLVLRNSHDLVRYLILSSLILPALLLPNAITQSLKMSGTLLTDRPRILEFVGFLQRNEQQIVSETFHLYCTSFYNQRLDMGDSVELIAAKNGFGDSFSETFRKYKHDLNANPPTYILHTFTDSNFISTFIKVKGYKLIRQLHSIPYGNGGFVELYQLPKA